MTQKMSTFLKDKIKQRVKVPVDEAPCPEPLIWGAYFLVITGISTALSYSSASVKAIVDGGFSVDAVKEVVTNFTWNSGTTNCTSLQFLVGVHLVYVAALYAVTQYANARTTIPGWLAGVKKAHNVFLAALSFFMLVALLVGGYIDGRFDSLYAFGCRKASASQPGLTVWAMYLFYLSKMLEFIDTFLLVLSKKKVILLHKVHHLTTMSLVWHAMEAGLITEILCGSLNCFVHTIMYAYFAFPKGLRYLRQSMTTTQILQFVFCLVGFGYALYQRAQGTPCDGTLAAEIHGTIMYGVYLAMFTAFFIKNYCNGSKAERKNKAEATAQRESKPANAAKEDVYQYPFGQKLLIWGAYFGVLAAAGTYLMQGTATHKALSSGDLNNLSSTISSDIANFQWVSGVTRAGSWQFLAAVHVVYAGALQICMKVMNNIPKRIAFAEPVSKAHNVLMAGLSLFMMLALVAGGIMQGRFNSIDDFCCNAPKAKGLVVWTMYVFYLSKMLEFIDTFLLVLKKKNVILLHKIHHLTTMSLVWHSLETSLPSDILAAGLNCFVHTLMYAYFAFPKGNRWLRQPMTTTQILQFVLCLAGIGYAQVRRITGTPCSGTNAAEWHGLLMYGVYLALFGMFFVSQYCGKRKSKSASKKTKPAEKHEVILFSKRVDVTSFMKKHPGGTKVLRIFQNRDATEQFEAYHSDRAYRWLKALPKRDCLKTDYLVSETPMAKDFRAMIEMFKSKGFYKADMVEEIVKVFLVFGPIIFGQYCLMTGSSLLGCLSMGFGMYYGGWVSHDYLHHAVFRGGKNRDETTAGTVVLNNIMGYIIGFAQGYEVDWWRARHNTHHVVTNEHGNDPDIKTAPVLTYVRNSPTIAKGLNFIQRWQQYYYLPVMAILDVYWRAESVAYILMRMPRYWKQGLAMLAHFAWMGYTFSGQWKYFWIMTLFRGFLTGTIVFSTHYGEDILDGGDHKMTLVEQTSKTSRNITGGYIVNLLTGFLSLQTEHHLFPMMPTANLDKARPYVIDFFKKHGLEYREGNIVECVKQNIKALRYDHVLAA
jgi:cytochrome b involved in lipid metabolism